MTSTPVKDVGVVPGILQTAQAVGSKGLQSGGFQSVLNGRTGQGTVDSKAADSKAAVKKTPGDSLKARDAHRQRLEERENPVSEDSQEEMSPEKLEELMAVLGTAAQDMIQQIADTFGMSVQEVEGFMDQMGLEALDVLEAGKLGELILSLGGASDSYALLTNGELYSQYQQLMQQLNGILEEGGEELGLTGEQMEKIMGQLEGLLADQAGEPEIPITVTVEDERDAGNLSEGKHPGEADPGQTVAGEGQDTQVAGTAEKEHAGREAKRDQEGSDRSGQENPFAQDFRTQQYEAELQRTEGPNKAWQADTQDIMRQIMDYMKITLKADTSSLEMQLHPASLGTLQIQIASKGGVVTANFITQNEAVKAALESQMVRLQESFEEQGVKVEAIEVTVQTHEFERNLDQGRGRNQGESSRRNRTRRIQLNDTLPLEDLAEEDTLTAQMMAAEGTTMDITV